MTLLYRLAPMIRSIGSSPVGSSSARVSCFKCFHASNCARRGEYFVSDVMINARVLNVGPDLCRGEIWIWAAYLHVLTLTQPTAKINIIVRMRRNRKACARFSVMNETSDPWSSKTLTACLRPDGELTITLAVARRTSDSNASIEIAESAFILFASLWWTAPVELLKRPIDLCLTKIASQRAASNGASFDTDDT